MFTQTSFINKKIRSFSWKLFNLIENNGNCTFKTNGEKLFIDNLFAQFASEESERIIFDIGANVGRYSVMIKDKAEKYGIKIQLHVFEPMNECFQELTGMLNEPNISLNNFGLSNFEETREIFYDQGKSGLASLYQRKLDHYSIQMEKSKIITVKRACDYIEEHNITHIDFIKIDIEGHELRALEGFGRYFNSDFISYIQFEYGGANLDSQTSLLEIYTFLIERGFIIAKVMKNGLEIRDYQPYMENFMYSNYLAISKKFMKGVYT